MKKGENIFKRKDGRWEARYIKGYELSGKIKYGFCYGKTYKEAKEKVTKHKAALLAGKPTPQTGTRHRFAFYCDEWLRLRKSKIRESTYIKYDTVLEKHIKPKLGGCFPMGITSGPCGDLILPDGIRSIASGAFANCTDLHSVILPESVEIAEDGAFRGCDALSIAIWKGKKATIGANAFPHSTVICGYTNPFDTDRCDTSRFVPFSKACGQYRRFAFNPKEPAPLV